MRMQYSRLKPGRVSALPSMSRFFKTIQSKIGMRHDAVMFFQIGLGVDAKVDDLFFGEIINLAQRRTEEARPMADGFLDAKRRPPLDHGALVEDAAVVLQERAALGEHFVFDHLIVVESEVASLFEDDLNMAGRLGMHHLVGHMGGEMLLQLRMALEKRQSGAGRRHRGNY